MTRSAHERNHRLCDWLVQKYRGYFQTQIIDINRLNSMLFECREDDHFRETAVSFLDKASLDRIHHDFRLI